MIMYSDSRFTYTSFEINGKSLNRWRCAQLIAIAIEYKEHFDRLPCCFQSKRPDWFVHLLDFSNEFARLFVKSLFSLLFTFECTIHWALCTPKSAYLLLANICSDLCYSLNAQGAFYAKICLLLFVYPFVWSGPIENKNARASVFCVILFILKWLNAYNVVHIIWRPVYVLKHEIAREHEIRVQINVDHFLPPETTRRKESNVRKGQRPCMRVCVHRMISRVASFINQAL